MAERRAGSILLLIASFLLSWSRRLVPVAEAMWLTIPSPRTKCISAEIESNVVILANYYIIDDEQSPPHCHYFFSELSKIDYSRGAKYSMQLSGDAVQLNNVDPSGRAALGFHLSPYDKHVVAGNVGMVHSEVGGDVRSMMEVNAAGLAIQKKSLLFYGWQYCASFILQALLVNSCQH